MLASIIRWSTEGRSASPNIIFLMLWGASLPGIVTTGLNYSLVRFVTPCFLALLMLRRFQNKGRHDWQSAILIAFLGAVVQMLLSPELAIAFSIGTIAFLTWNAYLLHSRVGLLSCIALACGDIALIGMANHLHVLDTLKAFSQGSMNMPITFNLFTVSFLLSVTITACYVGTALRKRTSDAWVAMAAVSFPAIPGALGLCDPPHLWNDPYGVILVSLLVASGYRLGWRVLAPIYLCCLTLLPYVVTFKLQFVNVSKAVILYGLARESENKHDTAFDHWVLKRLGEDLGPEVAQQKFANYEAYTHAHQLAPGAIFKLPGQTFQAPYTYSPSRFGATHAPELHYGFFYGTLNAFTKQEIQHKIDELTQSPQDALLLQPQQIGSCSAPKDGPRGAMNFLLLMDYRAPFRHNDPPGLKLCEYIRTHYERSEVANPEHYGYEIWRRTK